jgi:tRNA dimethylallyltransferase
LYIRALLRGLDPAPPADLEYRRELQGVVSREGSPVLHDRLKREAPELARRLHPHDHVRIMRALEVVRAGGPPSRQQWARHAEDYDVLYVGLTMERDALRRRLAKRAAGMVEHGLLDEVKTLLAHGYDPSLPSMHGIGYREFVQVAAGTLDAGEALRRMQRDTMRYAKRQWTWFAGEPDVQWIDVDLGGGAEGVAALVAEQLERRKLIP